MSDGVVSVSLRSTSYDVEGIAKQYGGGGHKKASAFRMNTAEFLKRAFR